MRKYSVPFRVKLLDAFIAICAETSEWLTRAWQSALKKRNSMESSYREKWFAKVAEKHKGCNCVFKDTFNQTCKLRRDITIPCCAGFYSKTGTWDCNGGFVEDEPFDPQMGQVVFIVSKYPAHNKGRSQYVAEHETWRDAVVSFHRAELAKRGYRMVYENTDTAQNVAKALTWLNEKGFAV